MVLQAHMQYRDTLAVLRCMPNARTANCSDPGTWYQTDNDFLSLRDAAPTFYLMTVVAGQPSQFCSGVCRALAD